MIYAIASYSVTFGALGLYWVLMAHRRRESAEAYARATGTALEDPRVGFHPGAALLAPFWMLRHGMVMPGALLIVPLLAVGPLLVREMFVPALFVGAVPAAAGAALGLVANRIGVGHTGLESPAEYSASQLPWSMAGVVLYTIVLPVAWLVTASGAI